MAGGGQNDLWQSLNCKGRYAGDIRIELTFYDTRPRESLQDDRRNVSAIEAPLGEDRERLSGPRQLIAPKRRPLPADPTSARASPAIQRSDETSQPPHSFQTSYYQGIEVNRYEKQEFFPTQKSTHDIGASPSRQHSLNAYNDHHDSFEERDPGSFVPQDAETERSPGFATEPETYSFQQHGINRSSLDEQFYNNNPDYILSNSQSFGTHHDYYDNVAQSTPPSDNIDPRLRGQPFRQGTNQSSSSQISTNETRYSVSPVSKNSSYDNSLAHRGYERNLGNQWSSPNVSPIEDHGSAPLPPAHASQGRHQLSQTNELGTLYSQGPVPVTTPVITRLERAVMSGPSLPQSSSAPPTAGLTQIPPNNPSSYSSPYASPQPSYTGYRHPIKNLPNRPIRGRSPNRDFRASMPPSLVPGYEPSLSTENLENSSHEGSFGERTLRLERPQPQYERDLQSLHRIDHSHVHNPEIVPERRAHRASVPVIRPRPISPARATPVRKSVSPRPSMPLNERQRSAIPFSPDSYEAFNPSIGQSGSVNDPGARYETPEQAKEASREAERQAKIGDGPIIGSNGRVIDPSDHLPTETWAPEPETKPPRKGPEVTLRFKRSPQGAQPMPPSGNLSGGRRPLAEARPNVVPNGVFNHHSAENSPAAAQHARLQKKGGRFSNAHSASSPAVPTVHSTPSPRGMMQRNTASDYPAYGSDANENQLYGNSPTYYGNRSPGRGDVPPPVPGKVPIHNDMNPSGMNALSEEMSRIDIGVSAGGRPRRTRLGA